MFKALGTARVKVRARILGPGSRLGDKLKGPVSDEEDVMGRARARKRVKARLRASVKVMARARAAPRRTWRCKITG